MQEDMMEIENSMVVDQLCYEQEYKLPGKARLKRQRQSYEEAEREDREDEN